MTTINTGGPVAPEIDPQDPKKPAKPSEAGTVTGIVITGLVFWPAALIWSIVLTVTKSWRHTTKVTGYVITAVTVAIYAAAITALVATASHAPTSEVSTNTPSGVSQGDSNNSGLVQPPMVNGIIVLKGFTADPCPLDPFSGRYAYLRNTTTLDKASALDLVRTLNDVRLYGIAHGIGTCLYNVESWNLMYTDEETGPGAVQLSIQSIDSLTLQKDGSYVMKVTYTSPPSSTEYHADDVYKRINGTWVETS